MAKRWQVKVAETYTTYIVCEVCGDTEQEARDEAEAGNTLSEEACDGDPDPDRICVSDPKMIEEDDDSDEEGE